MPLTQSFSLVMDGGLLLFMKHHEPMGWLLRPREHLFELNTS